MEDSANNSANAKWWQRNSSIGKAPFDDSENADVILASSPRIRVHRHDSVCMRFHVVILNDGAKNKEKKNVKTRYEWTQEIIPEDSS